MMGQDIKRKLFTAAVLLGCVLPVLISAGCNNTVDGSGRNPDNDDTLIQSLTPTAEVTAVAKTSSPQKSVNFTLTSTHTGEWKVYYAPTGGAPVGGVTASFASPVLTLTAEGANLDAMTWWVSVTESGRSESPRLGLTVEPYAAPPPSGTVPITVSFGGVPSDPVTVNGSASVSKTGGPLPVSVSAPGDYTAFEWRLDNVTMAQTGSTCNITVSSLSLGQHWVTVIAWKGTVPYSARIAFTLTN
jgi:hypothetical protein